MAVDGQVVGGIQLVAIEPVCDDNIVAVGVEAQDGPAAGAAAEELSFLVVSQAVGAVGAFAPDRYLVGLVVVVMAVLSLVGLA